MKNALTSAFVLLIGACQSDKAIGPSEFLHQRWQFSQTRRVNETTWAAPYKNFIDDTEYRADGTLVYRRNGVVIPTPCCSGGHFTLKGATIDYSEYPSCPSVRCSSNTLSLITVLAKDLLELQNGDIITQYTPVK